MNTKMQYYNSVVGDSAQFSAPTDDEACTIPSALNTAATSNKRHSVAMSQSRTNTQLLGWRS